LGDESFYVHDVEIDDRYVAATPEGVSLEFVLAGLGSRFVAILLDTILQGVLIYALSYATAKVVGSSSSTRDYVDLGVVSLIVFLVGFGYFVLFETLNRGRSPGKALTGLRVVRANGGPVGFRASLLRNVVRLADLLPAFYFLGALLIPVTKRHQRLGDMLAGTLVVRERTAVSAMQAGTPWTPSGQWSSTAWAAGPVPPWAAPGPVPGAAQHPGAWAPAATPGAPWLPPELAHWDVTRVGDGEMVVLSRFMAGRAGYTLEARARLATDLASRLWPLVAGPTGPMDAEQFLQAVWTVKAARSWGVR